jgi:hypothetical protein
MPLLKIEQRERQSMMGFSQGEARILQMGSLKPQ